MYTNSFSLYIYLYICIYVRTNLLISKWLHLGRGSFPMGHSSDHQYPQPLTAPNHVPRPTHRTPPIRHHPPPPTTSYHHHLSTHTTTNM